MMLLLSLRAVHLGLYWHVFLASHIMSSTRDPLVIWSRVAFTVATHTHTMPLSAGVYNKGFRKQAIRVREKTEHMAIMFT